MSAVLRANFRKRRKSWALVTDKYINETNRERTGFSHTYRDVVRSCATKICNVLLKENCLEVVEIFLRRKSNLSAINDNSGIWVRFKASRHCFLTLS